MKKLALLLGIIGICVVIGISEAKEIQDGIHREYYKNGQLKVEGTYKNGKQEGLWKKYYENGQVISEETYKDGIRIK